MPRNTSQVWVTPAGNPVQGGTNIDPTVHNNTINDLGAEVSNSLMRDGNGTMAGQFKAVPGTAGTPGISFVGDLDTGLYNDNSSGPTLVRDGIKTASFGIPAAIPKGMQVSTSESGANEALRATAPPAATATVSARKPGLRGVGDGAYKPGVEVSNDPGGWSLNSSSGYLHVAPVGMVTGGNAATRNIIQASALIQMKATINFDAFGAPTFVDNLNVSSVSLGSDYVQINFANDMGPTAYFPIAMNSTGNAQYQWIPESMNSSYMQFRYRSCATNAAQALPGPLQFVFIIYGACPES